MANRLNVLVGATLEQNVEKKLNTEIKGLSQKLEAISVKINFDESSTKVFEDAIKNSLKNLFKSVEFVKTDSKEIGVKIAEGVASGIKDATKDVTKQLDVMTKETKKAASSMGEEIEKEFGKALSKKQTRMYAENADGEQDIKSVIEDTVRRNGIKISEKTNYHTNEKGESWTTGSTVIVDDSDNYYEKAAKQGRKEMQSWMDAENQIIANAYADREKIHKQNADREQKAFDEEQKRNQEHKQLLQNLYSTYTETEKKTKNLSDTYGSLTDVNNKKFYKQTEANSYAKSLDKIAQKLVDNEHNTENLLEVQKELNDLLSKLDARDKELDSQVKADDKAKVARKKYNDEVKKSKDLLTDLKKTATDSRAKLDNLKSAFPEVDFSEEEKEVRSLEGAVRSYERTVNATGKSTEYFTDQQRKLKGWNSTAKSTSSGLDSRLEQETRAAEKAAEAIAKARLDAEEKYNKKLYSEHQKALSSYKELDSAIENLYKQTDGSVSFFGTKQAKEIDSFEKELSEIEVVLKKDNVATWEVIRAQERLTALQNNVDNYVSGIKSQSVAQNKLAIDIQNVREQLSLLDAQMSTKAIKLGSRYGDLFNEQEFQEVYSLTKNIENELNEIEPDFKKINSYFKQINANANKFEAELSASAKEAKRVKAEVEILDSSLGRFVQFYWFGEIFRTGKTAVTEMVSAVSTLDASMVELKKVSDETDSTYERFMDNAANSAKELGVSISDYIDSVTSFARSGFGFEDSQEIAKTANIMQMVSEEMSAEDASSYLISIIRGFNMEASESIDIVNALNNVSNNFAVTTDGLGDALQRSSAALKTAGNDLNESIALIATANETIQNPTSVGQGWKTISINYLVA